MNSKIVVAVALLAAAGGGYFFLCPCHESTAKGVVPGPDAHAPESSGSEVATALGRAADAERSEAQPDATAVAPAPQHATETGPDADHASTAKAEQTGPAMPEPNKDAGNVADETGDPMQRPATSEIRPSAEDTAFETKYRGLDAAALRAAYDDLAAVLAEQVRSGTDGADKDGFAALKREMSWLERKAENP